MTTGSDAARILAEGPPAARLALACDEQAPPEALYYLMADPSPEIRRAVAGNPATPHQSFPALAGDTEEGVRHALATRLATLAPGLGGAQRDRLAQAAWDALARLAGDAAEEIRATIAEAVKDLPEAPREIVLALAHDTSFRVAEPVIRLSPLLTEEDLLGLVAAPPVAETLTAVARRPEISEAVADALVATGDVAAIGALLANGRAAIRESTLDALVVQAAERTSWQEPLVRRPALPARAALALAHFVAEEILAPLLDRPDLPPETAAQIRSTVVGRLAARPRGGETAEDAALRAELLLRAGALTEAVMLRAAQAGEAAFVTAGLAGLAGVPRRTVEHAVATRCTKSLAGLCRQAGLHRPAAEAVLGMLCPAMPEAGTAVTPALVGDGELKWRMDALSRAAAR
ncbi:uncharacterized protein (DUF2336 family) [Roseomonas alkaliterrae]|uniref:Uncharacterized protein (DUF2336 family) n=2 Tax=Neoroseomonas alkaliterrae TaxID=1452450 RepID=A0A840XLW9_9PROT|nr:DUF2336 domain-containing protein [Neoroseomonas alkaliterrae]MBB5688916.1 uncharacterized protein (DUF2336 family) [Neoroseomonas alkaliterrae]